MSWKKRLQEGAVRTGVGLLVPGGGGYLIRDDFQDVVEAGNLEGRLATPGPGNIFNIQDTQDGLSVSDGELKIQESLDANWDDPRFVYQPRISRVAGRIIVFEYRRGSSKSEIIGVTISDSPNGGSAWDLAFRRWGNGWAPVDNNADVYVTDISGHIVHATAFYKYAIVLNDEGGFLFIKGDDGILQEPDWRMIFVTQLDDSDDLYIGYNMNQADPDSSFKTIRVPRARWLPDPLVDIASIDIDPSVGAEQLTNPGFEGTYEDESGGGGGTINVAPNWNNANIETDGSDTLDEETTTVRSGSSAQYMEADSNEGVQAVITLDPDTFYRVQLFADIQTGATLQLRVGSAATRVSVHKGANPGTWQFFRMTFRGGHPDAAAFQAVFSGGESNEAYLDDASLKVLSLASMLSASDLGTPSVLAHVEVGVNEQQLAGLALCVDDPDNPQNGIFIFVRRDDTDGDQLLIDKVVDGTWSNVATLDITYGGFAVLKAFYDAEAEVLYVFYNGAQVDSDSDHTISDASIKDNTYHGAFESVAGGATRNLKIYGMREAQYAVLDQYFD